MRFIPVCTSTVIALLASTFPALAEPITSTDAEQTTATAHASDRIPHPVVYLDNNDADAPSASERTRIPHPVVYLDAQPAAPESEPAALPANPDLDTSEPEVAKPNSDDSAPAAVVATPAPKVASPAAEHLAAMVEQKAGAELDDAEWAAVAKHYEARGYEPVWIEKTGVTAAGRKLVTTLETADLWGLDPNQFAIPDVANAAEGSDTLSAETWAELELSVAAAALRYASHARGGRILNPTEQLSSYIDRKPQLKDPAVVLADLFAAEDPSAVLHSLHPSHPQFEKLRQKYLHLKAAHESTDIVRIPPGALLRKGTTHAHVALLRKRLEIAEVAPDDGSDFDPELFDDAVLDAVKTFQTEYGISADGLVGNGTRRALNDIALPDPEKILANMEQWRWMPDDMGDVYVWVNVPEYKVRVVRDGQVILEERIIAGKINQQTPVFSDEVETLYFHPKWHVPNSIKVRELYPSLARGGASFRRQNLRIAYNGRPVNPNSIDWSTRDIRRYHVYQPPGRGNVLGVVKFTFPNKHMVYMHDTPTKHLFKTKQRTYSHGCMRVQNPVKLAELIVETANGMSKSDVADILNGPVRETPVKLDRKIPVHVSYFTAWVDEDGNEQAAKDIYGHEKKIKLALAGHFDKIAVGPDHLAPVKYKPRPQYTGTTAVEDFFKNLFPGF